MKLVRVTFLEGSDWSNFWFCDAHEAAEYAKLYENKDTEPIIEHVDVPTTRQGLADALNMADANHTVWPGRRIK